MSTGSSAEELVGDLQVNDVFKLNGRLVRVIEAPRARPDWKVLVEDVAPRHYDVSWHLSMKVEVVK